MWISFINKARVVLIHKVIFFMDSNKTKTKKKQTKKTSKNHKKNHPAICRRTLNAFLIVSENQQPSLRRFDCHSHLRLCWSLYERKF